jgi:hypothetical protein
MGCATEIDFLGQNQRLRPPQSGEMKQQKVQGKEEKAEGNQAPSDEMDRPGFQPAQKSQHMWILICKKICLIEAP